MIELIFYYQASILVYSRILVELFIFYILFRYRYKSRKIDLKLDEKTIDSLIEDFRPEKLIDVSTSANICNKVRFASSSEMCELADYDIFNLKEENKFEIEETIKKYGIGTCGPPGFYGTLDIHLKLEALIAQLLGTEDAILYSNSYTCTNSVITCFCRQYDVVFYHQNSNEAIVRALKITKGSSVIFNSLDDLEEKIKRYYDKRKRNFIVTEALFRNTGEITDLPRLLEIKTRNRVRLILDESLSIPILGAKGASSYFGTDIADIDIIIGSLSHVFVGNGGFSTGSLHAVDYQRLSAQSYCFSASMPGFLAMNAICNFQKNLDALSLRNLTAVFFKNFKSNRYKIISSKDSPFVFIRQDEKSNEMQKENCDVILERLWMIKYNLEKENVRLGVTKNPCPCLKVCLKITLTDEDITKIAKLISNYCK
ncbi:serine palmitoyltransferase component [Conglomerata obtusa]